MLYVHSEIENFAYIHTYIHTHIMCMYLYVFQHTPDIAIIIIYYTLESGKQVAVLSF